jgi:hypothetical protein
VSRAYLAIAKNIAEAQYESINAAYAAIEEAFICGAITSEEAEDLECRAENPCLIHGAS